MRKLCLLCLLIYKLVQVYYLSFSENNNFSLKQSYLYVLSILILPMKKVKNRVDNFFKTLLVSQSNNEYNKL